MLVLSRRLGETLMIGDDVKVTVLGISGNQVRLGIAAPRHVDVHREEVYNRIQGEHATQQQSGNIVASVKAPQDITDEPNGNVLEHA